MAMHGPSKNLCKTHHSSYPSLSMSLIIHTHVSIFLLTFIPEPFNIRPPSTSSTHMNPNPKLNIHQAFTILHAHFSYPFSFTATFPSFMPITLHFFHYPTHLIKPRNTHIFARNLFSCRRLFGTGPLSCWFTCLSGFQESSRIISEVVGCNKGEASWNNGCCPIVWNGN